MLLYLSGTPIWRLENSANVWNLLWLSGRLIISTEQTSIYVIPFPNALTSKKARNPIQVFHQLLLLIRFRKEQVVHNYHGSYW